MKVKKLLSVLGLGLFAAVSVGAGVVLNKGAKAEAVSAEDDTWMVHFSLNSKEIAGYMDTDSMWIQTYTDGVGNSKWFQCYPISSGSQFFAVNATFPESYTFDRIQYKFSQSSVEKWGVPYTTTGSKASHSKIIYSTFGSWSGDEWTFSASTYPEIMVEYKDVPCYLQEDPANKRFIASNFVSDESDQYTFYYRGSWDYAQSTLTDSSKSYFSYITTNWGNLNKGTYDVILKNDNSDGGIIELKKHTPSNETWIYYVTESSSPTVDYIYTFGGSEQFGAWPGTKIADLVAADKADEVTNNGVFHFQGGDPKLIYRIQLDHSYPTGDNMFQLNNGTDAYKSADRAIVDNQAYWWSGDYNIDAAQALNFIITFESYRNDVEDDSVCNISKVNATYLVNSYNGFSDTQKEIYIDPTTIYTWADASKESNSLWTVKTIMEYLDAKYELGVLGSSRYIGNSNFEVDTNNSIATIVIISVVSISVISLAAILVVKKRKHE